MRPHRSLTAHRRMLLPVILVVALIALVGAGCTANDTPEQGTVQLEPVSYTGANPFTPPVGTDQSGVTPPPQAGGTFPGDTVGLYGGSATESGCDQAKLVAYLQENPAKATAWAGVLGIVSADIPTFVAGLTPALLRSDTRVTNHGFSNGAAVAVPAVLQAGTAVLVDAHGFPVTKCFCGNPLTAPTVFSSTTFVGPQWTTFVATSVTVIVPVTQVVNQFTIVEPGTGNSFQRPTGSSGGQDGPVTTAAPQSPPPPSPSPQPRETTAPPTTPPPATTAPPPTTVGPPTTAAPGTGAPTQAPPTQAPSPPQATGPALPPPVAPTPAPPATVSPSPSATAAQASWVIGDCYVAMGQAHAVVLVRSDGPPPTFMVSVRLGPEDRPYAVESVPIATTPGQIAPAVITAATAAPDGPIPCAITSIVDESGAVPTRGAPIPPPPDTRPEPAPSEPTPSSPGGSELPPGIIPAPS
jgi:hypothetical protein